MRYDLSNPLHRQQLQSKVTNAIERMVGVVEFRKVKPQRTCRQNKYLHTIIAYFATQYGETKDYVKQNIFKVAANRDIFVIEKTDPLIGKVRYLRSSSDLDMDEMRLAIERFRNWSSMHAGIYIPSAEERDLLDLAEIEISRNQEYL